MSEVVRHTEPLSPGHALIPQNMDQAVRLAQAMSTAKMMPRHLHDDVGTCLMVVEQAMRWRMSPFAVAQCTSKIGDKLMYEGKLVAAACESVGAIVGNFDYQFSGNGDDRTVLVSAIRRGERVPRTITIRVRDVKTNNELWKKQPDQQLVYSGTRNWARRWTPSVILGVYAPEEFGRNIDAVVERYAGPTIDAEANPPEPTPEPPPVPQARRWRDLVTAIAMGADYAHTEEQVAALGETEDVQRVYQHANETVQAEVTQILADAMARVRGEDERPAENTA